MCGFGPGLDCEILTAPFLVQETSTPLYDRFFSTINQQRGGMKFLVDLRADTMVSFFANSCPFPSLSSKQNLLLNRNWPARTREPFSCTPLTKT